VLSYLGGRHAVEAHDVHTATPAPAE
jgi:hypothetical protein